MCIYRVIYADNSRFLCIFLSTFGDVPFIAYLCSADNHKLSVLSPQQGSELKRAQKLH
nr:MAG TPA: hypothetical protein [Caudoviricetes sp.]